MEYQLNTSNPGKLKEFQQFFALHGHTVKATCIDLKEIDADPITVVTHKASQLAEGIIVEDTTLDIEGETVGIHVRWLLDHLSNYIGRQASWIVLMAYRSKDQVFIFKGELKGKIVSPQGTDGFGFDPVFMPEGSNQTLAELKDPRINARAAAVEALLANQLFSIRPVMKHWTGPWQQHPLP